MTRFNPLDHPIAFQIQLRRSPVTDWWGHIPFAGVLIDLLKPTTVVELGVNQGDSLNAFAQAVQALELPTKCHGIDAWLDIIAYGERNPDEIIAFFTKRYPFVTIHSGFFKDFVSTFPDNSIDLLHIDGDHTGPSVREDYALWLPKLAPNGIVLFHDIAVGQHPAVEVDVFWKELRSAYPTSYFEFSHAWGLGMLAPKGIPSSLSQFFSAVGTPDEAAIQTYFQLLGARLYILTLYRLSYGDYHLLEGINANSLVSDPRLLIPGAEFTMGPAPSAP